MLATYVPPIKTELSFDEATRAMVNALAVQLGQTPEVNVLALALAKTALETGRWRSMWCSNWGNIKAGARHEGLYTCITLNEVLGQRVVWFAPEGELNRKGGDVIGTRHEVPPGHPQTRMRAYQDPFYGALEYIDFVATGRYRDAWAELLQGDALAYVHALKLKGYFTADEAKYGRAVLSLQREFIAKLEDRPAPEMQTPEPEEIHSLIAAQPFNADEVRALTRALDDARNLTRQSRDAQMAIDPTDDPPDEGDPVA